MAEAQEPIVRIGTVLTLSGHEMPVKEITSKGVIVKHQGQDLPIGRDMVETAVEEALAANADRC